jgi:hypothetical protein
VIGPPGPRSGERYTEQQLAEILRRAAERQEGLADGDGRFSLAEIQQIAAEVGISPAHVATAAVEVAHPVPSPKGGALGAPTVFRFERWIDGEVPAAEIGALLDIARRTTGIQGAVTEALDTIEWRGRGNMDATNVTVTRRQGYTRIAVELTRADAAALTVTAATLGAVGGGMTIGVPLMDAVAGSGDLAGIASALVALGLAGAGSWLATRIVWRRIARGWPAQTHALGAELVEAAQRAIDVARTQTG